MSNGGKAMTEHERAVQAAEREWRGTIPLRGTEDTCAHRIAAWRALEALRAAGPTEEGK